MKWEDSQWDEEELSGDLASGDTGFFIQEGDSSLWSGNEKHPTENAQFKTALKEFQKVAGLPVTGLFDDATKAAMNKPRCGVPDKEANSSNTAEHNTTTTGGGENTTETDPQQRRDPEKQTMATRADYTQGKRFSRKKRHLAALLGTNRRRREGEEGYMAFSKTVLRWRLIGEGYSSQLSIDDQRYIFRLAFRMWSEVSPLKFVEDTRSPLEDIDIRLGFGTGAAYTTAILFLTHWYIFTVLGYPPLWLKNICFIVLILLMHCMSYIPWLKFTICRSFCLQRHFTQIISYLIHSV